MSPADIALIWAQDRAGVIGVNGTIPWDIPEDRAYFREKTWHGTVVMGRATFESLGSAPLSGRANIIISSSLSLPVMHRGGDHDDTTIKVVRTMSSVLECSGKVWIIGGEQVYTQFLPYAQSLYITSVGLTVPVDSAHSVRYAPSYRESEFQVTQESQHTSVNNIAYCVRVAERIKHNNSAAHYPF